MDESSAPPGWHPDPTGRFEFRWFNGTTWTADVSVHGERLVDPATLGGGPQPDHGRNGRAVAALVLGLVGITLACVPVLFVAAGVAAVLGTTFGVLALRHPARLARGMATWGLVLSILSFAGLPVGWWLTTVVVDRIERTMEAGAYEIAIDACETSRFSVTLRGSITNRDDTSHDYAISVRYLVDGEAVATDEARSGTVEPGETTDFVAITNHRVAEDRTAECVIAAVRGAGLLTP